MKNALRIAAALALGLMLTVTPAFAQGKGKGHGKGEGGNPHKGPAGVIFTDDDRGIIGEYFRRHETSGLPPGLAKRDTLPPGLEKQLRERGTLPPGLQKKIQPLPVDLDGRLHRLPGGYRRVIIGRHVIVLGEKTSIIYDILRDAIP